MKWAIFSQMMALLLIAAAVTKTTTALPSGNSLEDEDAGSLETVSDGDGAALTETARFGFFSVNSDGSVSLTFNATSLEYLLLAALTALTLAAILLPLLGLVGKSEPDYSYAYVDQQGYAVPSYGATGAAYPGAGSGGYKRSIGWGSSIMEALSKAYSQYEANSSNSDDSKKKK
jgi:hypothetical protein